MYYEHCVDCEDVTCWGKPECKIFEAWLEPIIKDIQKMIIDRNQNEELFLGKEDKMFYLSTNNELFWLNYLNDLRCYDITIIKHQILAT